MNPVRFLLAFSAFCALFLAVIPHIIWFVGWLISLFCENRLKYAPFGWTALALVVILVLSMTYGFYVGRWRLKVKECDYSNKVIPAAFDGFRIVHISDFHLGTFDDNPAQLQRFVEAVNAQNPDLVCFTGDLVSLGYQEAEPYAETLKKLSANNGVVSVLGNHDFFIYSRKGESERLDEVEKLAEYERDTLGWNLLRNASMKIESADGSYITVLGVDNKNCSKQGFKTIDCGCLANAMEDTDGFGILLSHDPSHWEAEVVPDTDIQLTLSGHTHAAQFGIFGWNAASLMFRQSYGRYDIDGQTIYVNPGLGCTAPFRLGARPEITVITLLSAE